MTEQELGQLVSRKRGSTGIRAAAAEIGISPATLSRVERGHVVDVETLNKIFSWLDLDARSYFGQSNSTENTLSIQVVFKNKKALQTKTAQALAKLIIAAHESFSKTVDSEGH